MKLICFPYAGGSSAVYAPWRKLFEGSGIELVTPELAGRGRRMTESTYTDTQQAVADMLTLVSPHINEGPYALFGHSMGAMLNLRLLQQMTKAGLKLPVHAFFSGRKSLQVAREKKLLHDLPAEEFKQEVLKLGGTPKEFFDEPELMELFIPTLRSDFKLAELNRYDETITPFSIPITVMVGETEDLLPAEVDGWKEWSTVSCQIYRFEGGHFFINNNAAEIVGTIVRSLQKHLT